MATAVLLQRVHSATLLLSLDAASAHRAEQGYQHPTISVAAAVLRLLQEQSSVKAAVINDNIKLLLQWEEKS